MTTTNQAFYTYPCPYCGSFKVLDEQVLSCTDCKGTMRRSQYKVAVDYAEFTYRYGHLFRSVYEQQLQEEQKITPVSFETSHPVAIGATLVTICALHGPDVNWFLTKNTVKRMCSSFNEVYEDDIILEDGELRNMNKNIRDFTQDFSDSDTKLRNAVFEEIFADHCGKQDHEKLIKMQLEISKAEQATKATLQKEFDTLFQKIMAKTFKKVSKLPKPDPVELNSYWSNVLKMM